MGDRLIDVLRAVAVDVADPDGMVTAFVDWAHGRGTTLYPHQEEAILELYTGANVVLATPTGSGKSLVALAAHATSVCGGGRSWYTAPVKALVSEKFFDLCEQLGPEHVGLLTGDSAVNPDAPVICCTTEILALAALREGPELDAAAVILDEFHYYGEPDRGWAWQTPLIALPQCQFLLMSATLGDVSFFRRDLTARTGRPTALVDRAVRPVPLAYEWRSTTLHRTVEDLLDAGQAPLYVVNFSQAEAVEVATAMASVAKLDAASKALVAAEIAEAKLASGFGKDLGRLLRNGVGVHHAGMLPRYRRLVERLAQRGALRVVSGTDTLGVGVNLPIRTVVLTRLYKYDGSGTGLLGARAFHQIAGRAGRAGYDTAGLVVALAPDHVAENLANEAKAAGDPGKKRKLHKVAAPKGFVHYDEETFTRLQGAPPEPLTSSFTMTPGMLMQLLDRPGDTYRNVRAVLVDNHEPRARQRRLIRNTIKLYKGLRAAGAVRQLAQPDALGRRVEVDAELQDDFALDQLLAPFLLHAIPQVPRDDPGYPFAVLALVESVCDNPMAVLMAQRDKARDEAMAAMKADHVEYEERIERLEKITWPQPLRDDIYQVFDAWRGGQPWIGDRNIAPKGVVRDMWDRALDFPGFVRHYGLKRAEGALLRYLSDVFKTLTRSVPIDATDELLDEVATWLGAVIKATDSSLLDEWQALLDGVDADAAAVPVVVAVAPGAIAVPDDDTALRALVRTRVFRWVQYAAGQRWNEWSADLAEVGDVRWSAPRLSGAFAAVGAVSAATDARRNDLYALDERGSAWHVSQRLVVDDDVSEWCLVVDIDVDATRESGEIVAILRGIEPRD
jgi:superfamily II RNA helicase